MHLNNLPLPAARPWRYSVGVEGPLEGLGRALGILRRREGLTPEQLGNRMGIDGSGVRKQEAANSNPRADKLSRHLQHLGADLHDLARALDEVAGREPPAARPVREPSRTSLGMALVDLGPTAPEELLRAWALAHDEEQDARLRRQEIRASFASAKR